MSEVNAGRRPRRFLSLAVACLTLLALAAGGMLESTAHAAEGGSGGKSFVQHFFQSLGPIFMVIMGATSVCLVALIVWLVIELRMTNVIPPGFVEEFTDIVNKRKFKEAYEMARSDPSNLGKVLTAGMSRLQYGIDDARDASANMVESLRSTSEQKNNYLAVIGSLGPMLGLVGTVFGMVRAFMELEGSVDTGRLAGAISHALVVTLVGIAVSVPAIFFNAFFRNRITRVNMDCEHIADDLLTQMYHNSKKPAPAAPAAKQPTQRDGDK